MSVNRKRPLAAALLVAFGTGGMASAVADTVTVNRCNDQDGVQYIGYSLRKAINVAQEGDIVDMTALGCSTITLERGELSITQNSLTLAGPTDHVLSIDANSASRAINHSGTGTLVLDYLGAKNGQTSGNGGCIVSTGTLILEHATISECRTSNRGGGAAAAEVHAKYSTITGNSAGAGQSAGGLYSTGYLLIKHTQISGNLAGVNGGAAMSGGALKAYYSTFSGNHSSNHGGGLFIAGFGGDYGAFIYDCTFSHNGTDGSGGAMYSSKSIKVTRSTVSGNSAGGFGVGGIGGGGPAQVGVYDSTIDGNVAVGGIGGLGASVVRIVNSTVSGNSSDTGGGGIATPLFFAENSTVVFNTTSSTAAFASGGVEAQEATIVSSIVAKNKTGGAGAADVNIEENNYQPGMLTASASLIVSANIASASLSADPRLGPLADHGGGRRTHALSITSPAVNAGSNPINLPYDQRGIGFARTVGGAVDIGAYERQTNDDELFFDGFD